MDTKRCSTPAKRSRCSSTAPISTRPPSRSASTSTTSGFSPEFQSQGLSAARLLLHGAGRGSGILLDPPADRLARLQRLHGRHQADQGIHRLDRPPQDQGQHGHRADRRCPGAGRADRPLRAVLRRRRFPLAGRGAAAQGPQGHGVSTLIDPAADDRRRPAPPGRPFHRPRRRCSAQVGRDPSERAQRQAERAAGGQHLRRRVRGRRSRSDAVRPPAWTCHAEPGRDCPLCPRLVAFREDGAAAEPAWHNAPVPTFGADGRAGC